MPENGAPTTENRRFYDQDRIIGHSVELIKTFPIDVQHALAKGISMIAIKDHRADDRMHNFKSRGTETILPLYKSKKKRRYYDLNADFHNSINYFRILNKQECHDIARKVLGIASQVKNYLQTCKDVKKKPLQRNVEEIRDTYVEQGADRAEEYVQTLCDDLASMVGAPLTDISFDENRIRGTSHHDGN
jgi:hypothetical protein